MIFLRDLEKSCQLYITKEHTDIINSIDGVGGNVSNCGAPEIVSGSRDGNLDLNLFLIIIIELSKN